MHVEADPKLIEAFTLMWGTYPAPASLVHKSRTIIAVNEACRLGGREPGMNCAKWGTPDRHKGCRASRALREQKAFHRETADAGGVFRVYWLPVPDYPDVYVHFTTETINLEGKIRQEPLMQCFNPQTAPSAD
jgi:hypothetical protein